MAQHAEAKDRKDDLPTGSTREVMNAWRKGGIVQCGAAVLLLSFVGGTALAQDEIEGRVDQAFSAAFGVRYWYSTGETKKDLYFGGAMVSRLTYDGLDSHSGEIFGQVNAYRVFLKGNAGLGAIVDGSLQDEDFPPLAPGGYSSTDSEQKNGDLGYATIDVGGYVLDGSIAKLGGFVGYNYLHQKVNAFGCRQTTTNPLICVPTIPTSVAGISQENNWHSLRVGMNGEVQLGDRIVVSAEGAWLPLVSLDGADTHHLRICGAPGCFTGPLPEDGRGWGYQFEGMADFMVTDRLSFGLGGRYWHMETKGDTHFEGHIVGGGGLPEPVDWSVDIFGVLAEAKVTF